MLKVAYSSTAIKDMNRLPRNRRDQIGAKITDMAANPDRAQIVKLQGRPGYRLRVGAYRVILAIDRTEGTVLVLAVRPRGRAYR